MNAAVGVRGGPSNPRTDNIIPSIIFRVYPDLLRASNGGWKRRVVAAI